MKSIKTTFLIILSWAIFVVVSPSLAQTGNAEISDNLKTCLSGTYPNLCKKEMLKDNQKIQTIEAELAYNLRTCLTGTYPSFCNKEWLNDSQLLNTKKAELADNFKTCLYGIYPRLCKKDLLTDYQKGQLPKTKNTILNEDDRYMRRASKLKLEKLHQKAMNGDAVSQYNLFEALFKQRDSLQEMLDALNWLVKAAESGLAMAQYKQGWFLHESVSIAQNHEEAAKWYKLAAAQGNAGAKYGLSSLEKNETVSKRQEPKKQVPKYKCTSLTKSSNLEQLTYCGENGNSLAQFYLGLKYSDGDGVPQNNTLAIKWYKLSAMQGRQAAQNNLGREYDLGIGVKKDLIQAYIWYNLSASQGNEMANRNKENLQKKMTFEQILEAQNISTEWEKAYRKKPKAKKEANKFGDKLQPEDSTNKNPFADLNKENSAQDDFDAEALWDSEWRNSYGGIPKQDVKKTSSSPIGNQVIMILFIGGLIVFVMICRDHLKQSNENEAEKDLSATLHASDEEDVTKKTIKAEQSKIVELSLNQTEALAKNLDKEATPEVVTSENEHKPTNVWVKIVISIIALFVVVLLSAAITEIIIGRGATGSSNLLVIMELSVLIGIWHKTTATTYKRFVGIVAGIIGGTFLWYLMQVFMFSEMAPLPYIFMASSYAVAFYAPKYVCQR